MELDPEQILKYVESRESLKGEIDAYWESMRKLPDFDYSQFYSHNPAYESTVTQGDVLAGLTFVNLPDTEFNTGRGIVFSSTCDIELGNERKFPARMIYAPVMRVEAYRDLLAGATNDAGERAHTDEQILAHIEAIRNQKVGQIFYLPAGGNLEEEAMVFLDNVCSCDNESISREDLSDTRILSLSAYGWHIFLEKLGLFFTRVTTDTVELRLKPAT